MDREKMDEYFEKLLGPNQGKGKGYRPGWQSCDISRTQGGHLLTFHYKGAGVYHKSFRREFSLTEMQGKEVLPVLFPHAFQRRNVEETLAQELKQVRDELVDAQAVADASVRYGARMLEERDRARREMEQSPNTPHRANHLYNNILGRVKPFFPKGSRELDWDVLPTGLAKRLRAMHDALKMVKDHASMGGDVNFTPEQTAQIDAAITGTDTPTASIWTLKAGPAPKELEGLEEALKSKHLCGND